MQDYDDNPSKKDFENLTEYQKEEMAREYINLRRIDDYRIPVEIWVLECYPKSLFFKDLEDSMERERVINVLKSEDRLDEIDWYSYCFIECLIESFPPSQWLCSDIYAVDINKIVELMNSIKENGLDASEPISIKVNTNEMYCLGGNHRLLALNILNYYGALEIEAIPCLLVIDK